MPQSLSLVIVHVIFRWIGLSALLVLFVTISGALTQAGMAPGLWPSIHRVWGNGTEATA